MIHQQKTKKIYYSPRQRKITEIIESYSEATGSLQKIKLLSELKLCITHEEGLRSLEVYALNCFMLQKLSGPQLKEQQHLFVNVMAHFIKKIESSQQLDSFSRQIGAIIDYNQSKVFICLECLTEIIKVMQEDPPTFLQNYFIHHKLNQYLTLANIIISRYVVFKSDEQDEEEYVVIGNLKCIQAALALIHQVLIYDYGYQQRNLQTQQFEYERSPLILPTKYSRYANFKQFDMTVSNNNYLVIYETIFFNSNFKTQRLVIELMTDFVRIHFKFFKNRNNYRIFMSNIISSLCLIITRIQICSYEDYALMIQLGISCNAIVTTNILFDLQKQTRLLFYQCVQKFLNQAFDRGIITVDLITQYWNCLLKIQEKSNFNQDQTYNEEIRSFINRIARQYQRHITDIVVEPQMNIHPTLKQQLQHPNPQNIKALIAIFKVYKPKCSPKSYLPVCMNFEYWFNLYLSKFSQIEVKMKAANRIQNIMQFICEQQEKNIKNILIYILFSINELNFNLLQFMNHVGHRWQQLIGQSMKYFDETQNYIYELVITLKQQNVPILKNKYALYQQFSQILQNSKRKDEKKVKIYEIYYLMHIQTQIQDMHLLIRVNACFNNKVRFKYDESVQTQYQSSKLLFLSHLQSISHLLNIHELNAMQTLLKIQSNRRQNYNQSLFVTLSVPVYNSVKLMLQKLSIKYVVEGPILSIISTLLEIASNVKSIKNEPSYHEIVLCTQQLLKQLNHQQIHIKGYELLQQSLIQVIKCLDNCQQSLMRITNTIVQLWIGILNNYNVQIIKRINLKYIDSSHRKQLIQYICSLIQKDKQYLWEFRTLMSQLYGHYLEECQQIIQNLQIIYYFVWSNKTNSQEQFKDTIKSEKSNQIKNQENYYQHSTIFTQKQSNNTIVQLSQDSQFSYQ